MFEINFTGMSFAEMKSVIPLCAGVALCLVSITAAVNLITAALYSLVAAALLHAFLLEIFKLPTDG